MHTYLNSLSLSTPTKIQDLCFNPISQGKSVCGWAPTGSGKTLAFVLPVMLSVDVDLRKIQKLILVPTRELGGQIAQVTDQVSKVINDLDQKNVLVRSALGGHPIAQQIVEINKNPHVLVATPGRIIDLMERSAINLKSINTLILDEADVMVGMGFSEQVQKIYHQLNKNAQVCLFSATQNERVTSLEKSLLKNAQPVICSAMEDTSSCTEKKFHDAHIAHEYVISSFEHKYNDLKILLKTFELKNSGKMIIFCNLKETASQVALDLKKDGFNADALTGDHGQIHRSSIMRNFKTGNLNILVATNIAARGIDIEKLGAVIHYDIPSTAEEYIHRTGRTGRSGFNNGRSITFCNPKTKSFYLNLMESLEMSTQEIFPQQIKTHSTHKNAHAELKNKTHATKIEFFKLHLFKGKKHNIRPGDVLGAFIKELNLEKEDVGSIFIFDHFTHVEVNTAKKRAVLNKSFKLKNLAVKATEAHA